MDTIRTPKYTNAPTFKYNPPTWDTTTGIMDKFTAADAFVWDIYGEKLLRILRENRVFTSTPQTKPKNTPKVG